MREYSLGLKTKKKILLAFCLLLLLFLVSADIRYRMEKSNQRRYARVGDEIINVFEKDGELYLFLPGFAMDKNVSLSPGLSSGKLNILYAIGMDAVFINTESGTLEDILADKEHSETGRIHVIEHTGDGGKREALQSIKGHGNYSWNMDKKSFSFTLRRPDSILGLPEGQKYVLISNALDPTMFRNHVGRLVEEKIGLSGAHPGHFVALYINNNFMGCYYLTDAPEVGWGRIPVVSMDEKMNRLYKKQNLFAYEQWIGENETAYILPENPDDLSGGYLIEREFDQRFSLEKETLRGSVTTKRGEHYIVKSPDLCSLEAMQYLGDYMNTVEDAICARDDSYKQILDTDSFVRKYLAEEFMKNYDAAISSAYFYKDSDRVDGRLHAAPGWDYDMSLGNYQDWMEYAAEDGTGITRLAPTDNASFWWKELLRKKEFSEEVKELYRSELSPYAEELIAGELPALQEQYQRAFSMDRIRYETMYGDDHFGGDAAAPYEELIGFLAERKAFLDEVWQ